MRRESQSAAKREVFSRHALLLGAVLVLAAGVAALMTIGKVSQYLPNSNPAHYINVSSKMRVAPTQAAFGSSPLAAAAKVLPRPAFCATRLENGPTPPSEFRGVVYPPQLRSPPAFAA